MGKYDMAATYQDTYACTITDLCNEIMDEAEKLPGGEILNGDLVRGKLSNSQGSGIVQKLGRVGFPMWGIAGEDKREKYDSLKILKLFYNTEKDNISQEKRVNITRILLNPCIDNLIGGNGEVFNCLYQSVYRQVGEGHVYEQAIYSIDQEWKSLVNCLSRFIYQPDLVSKYDEICEALKRANDQLKAVVWHQKCAGSNPNDGVMRTLLILLIRYKILAANNSIRKEDDPTLKLETKYDTALKIGNMDKAAQGNPLITWEQIDAVTKTLKMDALTLGRYLNCDVNESFFTMYIQAYSLGSVTDKDIVSEENKIHRINAFRYVNVVVKWIQSLYDDLGFSEGVPLHILAGIVQSLYYVSKNRVQYSISSYGNARKRTLLAALKNGMNADQVAMLNMESRVADRILIVLGKKEMLDYYHSIRRILLEMEDAVISCHSLELIQEMHNEVFEQVRRICSSIS